MRFRLAKNLGLESAAACVFILGISGCSHTASAELATKEAAAPVCDLADYATRPKQFPMLFVKGAVPSDAQRKRFAELVFQVTAINAVSDTEAVLHVAVDDGKADRPAEVDWSVVKEDQRWKLKEAPLP